MYSNVNVIKTHKNKFILTVARENIKSTPFTMYNFSTVFFRRKSRSITIFERWNVSRANNKQWETNGHWYYKRWLHGNIYYIFVVEVTVLSKDGQEILPLDIERLCDFSIMWYTLLLFKRERKERIRFLSLYKLQ